MVFLRIESISRDPNDESLPKAVQIMATVQIGSKLSDDEMKDIVAFLGSLTGPLPATFATAPILPRASFGAESEK